MATFIAGFFSDQKPHFQTPVFRVPNRARHRPSSDTSGRRFVSPYLDRLRQGRGDMIRRELRRTGFDARNPKAETNSQACLRTRKPKPETRKPKPETDSQTCLWTCKPKPETRKPKPETDSQTCLWTCKPKPETRNWLSSFTPDTKPEIWKYRDEP